MGIDPCRADVPVSQQILHCSYVIAVFEQVGGDEWRKAWRPSGLKMPALSLASLNALCRTDW